MRPSDAPSQENPPSIGQAKEKQKQLVAEADSLPGKDGVVSGEALEMLDRLGYAPDEHGDDPIPSTLI